MKVQVVTAMKEGNGFTLELVRASESGTVTVSVRQQCFVQQLACTHSTMLTTSFTEDKTFDESSNDIIDAPTVDAAGARRLAVSFVFDTNNIALGSFTGKLAEIGQRSLNSNMTDRLQLI